MKIRRFGLSLAEIMIGVAISAVLGLAVYKIVSHAQVNAAKARCRGDLRLSIQTAARQIERDISSSRAILDKDDDKRRYKATLEYKGNSGMIMTMEIPVEREAGSESSVTYFDGNTGSEDALHEKLTYSVENNILYRNGEKSGRIKVASNIKSIESTGVLTYDGKIELVITAAAKPDGQTEELAHTEQLIVAIRQLQNKLKDGDEASAWKQRVFNDDY